VAKRWSGRNSAGPFGRLASLERVELVDGILVIKEPQTEFHRHLVDRLRHELASSKSSEIRDRETTPRRYAEAGIRHFWRVENDGGRPVVYVYELDPAPRAYTLTGIFHDRLTTSVPFPIDVSLTDLTR
jgi:Uma2 family endonuclease